MSRNLRPIRSDWGPHSSLFIDDPESLPDVIYAIMGGETPLSIDWNESNEAFLVRVRQGQEFIKACQDMDVDKALGRMEEGFNHDKVLADDWEKFARDDARSLLSNLKTLVGDWKEFVNKDNQLEILVDG